MRYKCFWIVTYNIVDKGVLWEGRQCKELGWDEAEARSELLRVFPAAVVTSVEREPPYGCTRDETPLERTEKPKEKPKEQKPSRAKLF